MAHPKEFKHSPLVDALIEVRFSSGTNTDILPGLLFSQLRKEFANIRELPTLQIPLDIRRQDPNLKFQATHRMESDDFVVNIGPNVIGLGCKINPDKNQKYPGWAKFFKKFNEVVSELSQLELISQFNRLGVRYVNLFERKDLFKDINIDFSTGWEGKGLQKDKELTFIIKNEEFKSRVHINNNVKAKKSSSKTVITGQVIDIDTFIEMKELNVDLGLMASTAHTITEDIFFGMLSDQLKEELGASYV